MPGLEQVKDSDILYRSWIAKEPRADLLLVHGLGAHSDRWSFTGEYFAKRGISCWAIELKGFGETKNRPQGHIDSFEIYYQDIKTLYNLINKSRPVFIMGESLGGLIAFNLCARNWQLFSGLVLISPSFKNGMKFPLWEYVVGFSSMLHKPETILPVPFNSAMVTRDVDYIKKMDNDPRELRSASAKLLTCTLLEQVRSNLLANKLLTPALFLIPGIDYLVDESASRKMYYKLPLKDKRMIEYPKMLHALSIELGREKVFADILSWIEERL